jgi:hypothetical protein
LKRRPNSAIVTMASASAQAGIPMHAVYAATKVSTKIRLCNYTRVSKNIASIWITCFLRVFNAKGSKTNLFKIRFCCSAKLILRVPVFQEKNHLKSSTDMMSFRLSRVSTIICGSLDNNDSKYDL